MSAGAVPSGSQFRKFYLGVKNDSKRKKKKNSPTLITSLLYGRHFSEEKIRFQSSETLKHLRSHKAVNNQRDVFAASPGTYVLDQRNAGSAFRSAFLGPCWAGEN